MNTADKDADIDYQPILKIYERYYPKKRNYTDDEVKQALEKKRINNCKIILHIKK